MLYINWTVYPFTLGRTEHFHSLFHFRNISCNEIWYKIRRISNFCTKVDSFKWKHPVAMVAFGSNTIICNCPIVGLMNMHIVHEFGISCIHKKLQVFVGYRNFSLMRRTIGFYAFRIFSIPMEYPIIFSNLAINSMQTHYDSQLFWE